MERPPFEVISSGEEFNQWYWLKSEMAEICKIKGLPSHGSKFDLRDRIMFALDHGGKTLAAVRSRCQSSFNWAQEPLSPETLITDNVSFGPNFRSFMKGQVGEKFTCNTEFMKWVKANEGKTLQDAVDMYFALEKRKGNPSYRSKIASPNMFNQYVRDFIEDNPGSSIKEARRFWLLKRKRRTTNGFVKYERTDLALAN